jgi:hypothetical protein
MSDPSALGTAGIALVSAVVGGGIAGGTQLVVEGRRASHERDLDATRAMRQQAERQAEDTASFLGAARFLRDEFFRTKAILATSVEGRTFISDEYFGRERLSEDDRSILSRLLTKQDWNIVSAAWTAIATVDGIRRGSLGTRPFLQLDESEQSDVILSGMRGAIVQIEQAIVALDRVIA